MSKITEDCKKSVERTMSAMGTKLEDYKKYLKVYESFVINLPFLKGRAKSNVDIFKDRINISDSTIHIDFVKPTYQKLSNMIEDIEKELEHFYKEYQFEKKMYLYGNDSESNKSYEKIEHISEMIMELKKCESILSDVELKSLEDSYLKSENARKQLQDLSNELLDMQKKIDECNDDIVRKQLIDEYIRKKVETNKQNYELKENIEMLSQLKHIELDLITKNPSLNASKVNNDSNNDAKETKVKKKEKNKMDEKIKNKLKKATKKNLKKNASNTGADEIIDNEDIKQKKQLKKFLFKNLEECKNSKRNSVEFMKMDDILEVIENTPSLKAKLPDKYKNMKKDDLCKALDDHAFEK